MFIFDDSDRYHIVYALFVKYDTDVSEGKVKFMIFVVFICPPSIISCIKGRIISILAVTFIILHIL